ncbi:MAG: hypothetical protein WD645_03010 [Dehalococcoidia bacterium]
MDALVGADDGLVHGVIDDALPVGNLGAAIEDTLEGALDLPPLAGPLPPLGPEHPVPRRDR